MSAVRGPSVLRARAGRDAGEPHAGCVRSYVLLLRLLDKIFRAWIDW